MDKEIKLLEKKYHNKAEQWKKRKRRYKKDIVHATNQVTVAK